MDLILPNIFGILSKHVYNLNYFLTNFKTSTWPFSFHKKKTCDMFNIIILNTPEFFKFSSKFVTLRNIELLWISMFSEDPSKAKLVLSNTTLKDNSLILILFETYPTKFRRSNRSTIGEQFFTLIFVSNHVISKKWKTISRKKRKCVQQFLFHCSNESSYYHCIF